eukprot:4586103-Pyramimonas_sp.AAC.1
MSASLETSSKSARKTEDAGTENNSTRGPPYVHLMILRLRARANGSLETFPQSASMSATSSKSESD